LITLKQLFLKFYLVLPLREGNSECILEFNEYV
jgi:hypothetical protein